MVVAWTLEQVAPDGEALPPIDQPNDRKSPAVRPVCAAGRLRVTSKRIVKPRPDRTSPARGASHLTTAHRHVGLKRGNPALETSWTGRKLRNFSLEWWSRGRSNLWTKCLFRLVADVRMYGHALSTSEETETPPIFHLSIPVHDLDETIAFYSIIGGIVWRREAA